MNLPKFKSPRLLPIVIFAAVALLLFKGIGIVTNGGYVLTGTQVAVASEAGSTDAPTASSPGVSNEPTMTDSSPTLTDTAPTVGEAAPAGHGAEPAAKGEGDKPAAGEHKADAAPAADGAAAKPDASAAAMTAPATDAHGATPAAASATACPTTEAATPAIPVPTAATAGVEAPMEGSALPAGCANALADAVAMTVNSQGQKVPLAGANGVSVTQDLILQRLGERRTELDKREAALGMREAIVAAAEKQMVERADALKALQTQIAALTDQKKSIEGDQLSGIVKMYETMKPQEAASIFDGLDMGVLLNVAKSMDPRKMSAILAKMSAARAQELTTRLAAADTQVAASEPTTMAAADPNALPQIVGH